MIAVYAMCACFVMTAADGWSLQSTLAVKCNAVEVDALDNIYLLYDDHLELRRAQDVEVRRISLLEYGSVYTLDVTNPLKPFLFFAGQGVVIYLDNMLSPQGQAIHLQEMGFEQIEVMAGSRGDHFWLWDGAENELLRVDQQFQVRSRTGNLSARLGKALRIQRIIESEQDVMLQTTGGDVILMDLYGTYKTSLSMPSQLTVSASANALTWIGADSLHVLNLMNLQETTEVLPLAAQRQAFLRGKRVFLYDGTLLRCYKKE
jgi:hypothetical protein